MTVEPSKAVLNTKGVAELAKVVDTVIAIFSEGNNNPVITGQFEILREKLPGIKRLSFPGFFKMGAEAYEEASTPTTEINRAAWLERAEAKHGEDSMAKLDIVAVLAAIFNSAAEKQTEKARSR